MFSYESMILLRLNSDGPNYIRGLAQSLSQLLGRTIHESSMHDAMTHLHKRGLVKKSRLHSKSDGRLRIYYSLTPAADETIKTICHDFKLLCE